MNPNDVQQLAMLLHEMLAPKIESTIQTKVNGKIDRLTESVSNMSTRMETYIHDDGVSNTQFLKTFNEWKDEITPVIEMGKDVRSVGKFFAGALLIIGSIIGIIYSITRFFK